MEWEGKSNGWDGIVSAIRCDSLRLDGIVFWMGWDRCGMDLKGWDLISSAMRCVVMRYDALPWDWLGWDGGGDGNGDGGGDGNGDDVMR